MKYFNSEYLPEASHEFVILADTHFMLDTDTSVEFESRRKQTGRVEFALSLINDLDPSFVVHLGDIVQEFPERPNFDKAIDQATEQLHQIDVEWHFVAGNHDVGDKPDPVMPTEPVTSESLAEFHDRFDQSWYSWSRDQYRFIVINSQILNRDSDSAHQQRSWLLSELNECSEEHLILFCHLPLFLNSPEEPHLGHYDNIGEPDRTWLLNRINQHDVDLVMTAHSHFSFRHIIDDTEIRVTPSPSFTRPGFSELFSSCAPPEQGRDDIEKLGFYLARIVDGDLRLHRIRTNGRTQTPDPYTGQRLLTIPTSGIAQSSIGVSLLHSLSNTVDVPMVFPSAVRQRVSNHYPELATVEAGFRYIRVMQNDLTDRTSRRSLRALKRDGISVSARILVNPNELDPAIGDESLADEIELAIPGSRGISMADLKLIESYASQFESPISVSRISPHHRVEGKQHDRLREGFYLDEIVEFAERLEEYKVPVSRALRFVDKEATLWRDAEIATATSQSGRLSGVDWLIPISTAKGAVGHVSQTLLANACVQDSRAYLQPLREMDRTMDTSPGLLDRRCNPTDIFSAVKNLNTLLYANENEWHVHGRHRTADIEWYGIAGNNTVLWLAVPGFEVDTNFMMRDISIPEEESPSRIITPESGRVISIEEDANRFNEWVLDSPVILRYDR